MCASVYRRDSKRGGSLSRRPRQVGMTKTGPQKLLGLHLTPQTNVNITVFLYKPRYERQVLGPWSVSLVL